MHSLDLKILIADDDRELSELLKRRFEKLGFTNISFAYNGEEALVRTMQTSPDLVLLDVMMPGLSGFDVLEAIRKLYPANQLQVLMVTAKDQSGDIVNAFKLGADDYITKPLDVPVMIARIRVHLRSRAAAPEPPKSLLQLGPGSVLEEKYRLESLIGSGSFGTVFRATHLPLERPVAIKIFSRGIQTAGGEARFRREAISACRIDHPNAVKVLDLSVMPSGVPFLVMELLEGRSLAEELQREGCLALHRCSELVQPICEVLTAARELGIVHRDVQPQNIFLHQGRQGEVVKVLDFGIAKLVDDSAFEDKLTLDGLVGTPTYMAPERFSGSECDQQVDVYSLGVMLYEMLTGRRPFESEGDLFKLIVLHMDEQPLPLSELRPELPPVIDQLVLEALSKGREDRPSTRDLARRFAAGSTHEAPAVL